MPPKRRRSSIAPVTAPLPSTWSPAAPPRSPSKIPRRKSSAGTATATTTATTTAPVNRRTSGIPRITPRQSLAAEDAVAKPTPHGDLRALAKSLDPGKQPRTPAKRQPPQTPARKTPGTTARTPGTIRKTPRTAGGPTVATPHTARAVKQLQNLGRSGGARKRNELRRESQRDVLRGLSKVLAKEPATTGTRRVSRRRSMSSSASPEPPDLQSRLSTPSSDDLLQPPRLSLTHDPLAPKREIPRTPTQRHDPPDPDSTGANSIEGARRAPLTRLSDRLSFGAADEVEDTMMNILANRPEPRPFEDDTFDYGDGQFGDDNTLEFGAVEDDIEGEYTANLKRLGSPLLLDFEKEELEKMKVRKPAQRARRETAPTLPRDLIRNLAQQFSSKPLGKDVLPILEKATDQFFQHLSTDLAAFAKHAGRKAIEENDVQILLQRQRIVQGGGGSKKSVFSVAQRYLPGELVGRVRMVKPQKRAGRKRKREAEEDS